MCVTKMGITWVSCIHRIVTIHHGHVHAELYIDDCYKKNTFLRVYNFTNSPLNGHELWPDFGKHELLPSIVKNTMIMKKNKVRRNEAG